MVTIIIQEIQGCVCGTSKRRLSTKTFEMYAYAYMHDPYFDVMEGRATYYSKTPLIRISGDQFNTLKLEGF